MKKMIDGINNKGINNKGILEERKSPIYLC